MILKALPQTQAVVNCTREHLAQLSKLYKAGDEFTCKQELQEWSCIVSKAGYNCNVKVILQPERIARFDT